MDEQFLYHDESLFYWIYYKIGQTGFSGLPNTIYTLLFHCRILISVILPHYVFVSIGVDF